MIRIVLFLISVLIIARGFSWVADRPGEIAITWMGYRVETSVMVAAFAVTALVFVILAIWSVLRAILRSPEQVSLFFRHRRAIKGYLAISRGLIAVAFVRMLPVAPFSVVNVVAGASHIRWSDFMLGTLIGLLPGIATMTFFVDRAIAAVRDPGAGTFALLALAVALILALVWTLRRRLGRRAEAEPPQPAKPTQLAHGS